MSSSMFSLNNDIHLPTTFCSVLRNSLQFNERLFNTFSEAYSLYLKTILEGNNISKDLPKLEKIVKSRISNIFNLRFREEDFVSTLSDTVASYSAQVSVKYTKALLFGGQTGITIS